ncbi:hypothetical protein D3C78_1616650 [compost metagenome]
MLTDYHLERSAFSQHIVLLHCLENRRFVGETTQVNGYNTKHATNHKRQAPAPLTHHLLSQPACQGTNDQRSEQRAQSSTRGNHRQGKCYVPSADLLGHEADRTRQLAS